jgi:tetratricopeptide (TPR) repeat protein
MFRIFICIIVCLAYTTSLAQDRPKRPFELREEAEEAYNSGSFQESLRLLDECLKINPGYMEAYPIRAGAKEQLKDLDGALTDYSIYLDKYPDHPDVLLSRAILRFKIGFYEQAREDFMRMLSLSSTETNALFFRQNMSVEDRNPVMQTTHNQHNAFVYNYLGLIETKLKNAKQAIVYLDTAIRLDSRQPDFFVNRGIAKDALNDSTAFADFELALMLNPNHTLARHNLDAWKAKQLKQMSAEERLSKTIAVDSTMLYPYLERAQQRFESGYFKGALDDYNQAIQLDSNNVEIWYARALTKEKLKDYEGAFSDYTKAIDLKENYAKAWMGRGNTLLKLERYDDAIEDYNVALIYLPEYALAYYNRAMAKVKLKKNPEACTDIKQAESLGYKADAKVKGKVCGD